MPAVVSQQEDSGVHCQPTAYNKNRREVSPAFERSSWGYCLSLRKSGYSVG